MPRNHTDRIVRVMLLTLLALAACVTPTPAPHGSRYQFFAPPSEDDVWFEKIADWQSRERVAVDDGAVSPGRPNGEIFELTAKQRASASLQQRYAAQSGKQRRELAQRFMTWSQIMAREHYKKDEDELADPWPTSEELLERGGDDCDGLDLLAYGLLRDFGFARNELYRAIVRRDRDRANHMVTLWFEDEHDPWVIDATGAISLGMRRMSELDGWTPTRVFNEYDQFSVIEKPTHAAK